MKPKILVLTSTFPRNTEDYEPRFIADLCINLKDEFDIHVLTQHRPSTLAVEEIDGVKIKRFRYAPSCMESLSETGGISNTLSQNPWSWLLVPLFVLAQILSIRKQIKTLKPDIIHSHWLIPQTLSAVIALKLSPLKPPLVSTSHGADIFSFRGAILSSLKEWLIKRCDRVCVVSAPMKKHLQQNLNSKGTQILVRPMGANIDNLFIPGDPSERKPRQLLYIGRLVKKKGVKNLLNAMAELNKGQPLFNLVVAGYGPELKPLQSLTTELNLTQSVKFTGSLTHKGIAELCRQSSLSIFPFIESDDGDIEGLGLVLIEAMGCKCPVIVGNVPAIADLVSHNKTGLICDSKNVDDLVANILKLTNDPILCQQLSNNAYHFVHNNYSWKISAGRYSQLFTELTTQ